MGMINLPGYREICSPVGVLRYKFNDGHAIALTSSAHGVEYVAAIGVSGTAATLHMVTADGSPSRSIRTYLSEVVPAWIN